MESAGLDELRSACVARDWDAVEALALTLQAETLSAQLSPDGWTALHFAAAGDSSDAVNALLQGGANSRARGSAGSTALHIAAWEGSERALEALLKAGCDPNSVTKAMRTPIHFAARQGNANLVQRLAKSGADIDATERDGRTALHFAAREGLGDTVQALVESGASILIKDYSGATPASAATDAGHIDVLKSMKPVEVTGADGNAGTPKRLGSAWGSIGRSLSDVFTGYKGSTEAAPREAQTKDDTAIDERRRDKLSRKEVYAAVGAGVIVSALIPLIRSNGS